MKNEKSPRSPDGEPNAAEVLGNQEIAGPENAPYVMRISRMTVDKLGVKLYDKASAVVAELIANAYDADAEHVEVTVPLSTVLATKKEGDKGYEIKVVDDGHGMTPEEVNQFYLKVGKERRTDPAQGPKSRRKGRRVMGRKGVGKLAPFGISHRIEVRSAGGPKTPQGHRVAHLVLEYDKLLSESEEDYHPLPGPNDGSWDPRPGTTITLSQFTPHRVPDAQTFHRQLAARFGLRLPDWEIKVVNSRGVTDPFAVGELDIATMENTRIVLDGRPVKVRDEESGQGVETLPVRGWVAYAKEAYKNPEIAGVRVFARGKIVALTRDFNIRSGFTGEYTIRSYVVGEVHADWIDEDEGEDLVKTDRQDILWESERGQAFQEWGRALLAELGERGREPGRARAAEVFFEASNLEEAAAKKYPDPEIRKAVLTLGKVLGGTMSKDDLKDPKAVERVAHLCISMAPQKVLVEALTAAARTDEGLALSTVLEHLVHARVAENASLGQVARLRVDVIGELEGGLDGQVDEMELQKIIESAPWLANPQWTPLTMNRTFATLVKEFPKWYRKQYGQPVTVSTAEAAGDARRKRPDFVMLHVESRIVIVELKRPHHAITDRELDRLVEYHDALQKFLDDHKEIAAAFPHGVEMLLVCDGEGFKKASSKRLFEKLSSDGTLTVRRWKEFVNSTKKAHDDFLRALGR